MDSGLSPDSLVRRCRELGLSAVCITEHNAIWSVAETRELSERFGIPIISGMEVSTDAGHVLAFGVEGYRPEMFRIERLRAIVESEGGVMVLAHPMRDQGFPRPWSEAKDLFVALEGMNGDDGDLHSEEYMRSIAKTLGMPMTGGSDAHTEPAVGRRATVFKEQIADERQLVDALLAGQFDAVDLSRRGPPEALTTRDSWLAS
jgi:predicted metal-dependent phosphoesterase TrpH